MEEQRTETTRRRYRLTAGEKLRGYDKVSRIPLRNLNSAEELPRQPKPDWIRIKLPASGRVQGVRRLLRSHGLATVCEEASCPNLGECFDKGTATFMIMGEICTRRCPFCDVAHGKPLPLDPAEPERLAAAVAALDLRYVVITSVDRDDLPDSGAEHFADCIAAVRAHNTRTRVEVLVPDFRGRMEMALAVLAQEPPDVFNHNLETVPGLYREVRPGASYTWSLELLRRFRERCPEVVTKSGLMLGLGETLDEVRDVMQDLRRHQVTMLTLGQYLQPGPDHLRVQRYLHPDEFAELGDLAEMLGFEQVASAPLVRSSYHADMQSEGRFRD